MKKIILIALSGFVIPIAAGMEHRQPAQQAQTIIAKKRNYRPYIIGGAALLFIAALVATYDGSAKLPTILQNHTQTTPLTIHGRLIAQHSTFHNTLMVYGTHVELQACSLLKSLIVHSKESAAVILTDNTSIAKRIEFVGAPGSVLTYGAAVNTPIVNGGICNADRSL